MRYTAKNGDWVEIEGAADTPVRDFAALERTLAEGYAVAHTLIKAGEFHTRSGESITLGPDTPADALSGLSLRQWFWLRNRILQAIRDEEIDPEA